MTDLRQTPFATRGAIPDSLAEDYHRPADEPRDEALRRANIVAGVLAAFVAVALLAAGFVVGRGWS